MDTREHTLNYRTTVMPRQWGEGGSRSYHAKTRVYVTNEVLDAGDSPGHHYSACAGQGQKSTACTVYIGDAQHGPTRLVRGYRAVREGHCHECGGPLAPHPSSPFESFEEEDRAWKQYNRRELAAMRAIIPFALADLGIDYNTKVTFSRNAGCSCGCSPGFILDKKVRVGGAPVDISVRVVAVAEEVAA